MSPITVIFCGTSAFACPFLDILARDPAFDVKLVITQPDKPVGRKKVITSSPVKVLAESLGLPLSQPRKINTDLQATRSHLHADFLVVVAYGQILSRLILEWPIIAPINVHASLLPRWKGASPIQHAILEGDTQSGVTIQKMTEKLDSGPILAQASIDIDKRETSVSLTDKMTAQGPALLLDTLKKIQTGELDIRGDAQNDAMATNCMKLTRERGVANPQSMIAEEIDYMVRALNPWPSVLWLAPQDTKVKILQTSLTPHPEALTLPCAKGTVLFVLSLQQAGKKPMTGAQWMRGRRQKSIP